MPCTEHGMPSTHTHAPSMHCIPHAQSMHQHIGTQPSTQSRNVQCHAHSIACQAQLHAQSMHCHSAGLQPRAPRILLAQSLPPTHHNTGRAGGYLFLSWEGLLLQQQLIYACMWQGTRGTFTPHARHRSHRANLPDVPDIAGAHQLHPNWKPICDKDLFNRYTF